MANKKTQNRQPVPGRNRAEKRANTRNPRRQPSGKPAWIRIGIIVIMAVMLLGFVVLPLLK